MAPHYFGWPEEPLDLFNVTGGILAIALFGYLLAALLRPELFE